MTAIRELSPDECRQLGEALEDRPETVITRDQLLRGKSRAWISGNLNRWSAAVVDSQLLAGEPMAFGSDASAILQILPKLHHWSCVEAEPELARQIGEAMRGEWGVTAKYCADVYYELRREPPDIKHPDVRLLTEQDFPLMLAADASLKVGSSIDLLTERRIAAAVVDGRIVAKAGCYAHSDRYADIGVQTLAEYRCRGYAAAAACLVARSMIDKGWRPVWSTGEDNWASQRVAAKVGFVEISRYLFVGIDRG
jgi:hypothetical protein